MSDGLLAIGAFSRASMLSIKSLRSYHESGLLVPARVDPETGYRSYHSSQLIDAGIIYQLRTLDLPLADIREVLVRRDPEITRKVLVDHAATMQAQLERTQQIVADLHSGIAQPSTSTPVHIATDVPCDTVAVRGRVAGAGFAEFLGESFEELTRAVTRCGLEVIGPPGALYPGEISDDGPEHVEAFLPISDPARFEPVGATRVIVSEMPAATVAVLAHAGPYDTIDDAYRRLGAWVAEHATPAAGPVREHYVVSYTETDDPADFVTDIHWPIVVDEP